LHPSFVEPARSSSPLSVSVVIPSLRDSSELVGAVEKILADARTETEVLVADNGLPQASADAVAAAGARLVSMGRNRGFGAAVNRAAAASDADVLVLFNDDAVPCDGYVEKLIAPLGGATAMAAGVLLRKVPAGLIETAGLVVDAVLSSYDHLEGEPISVLDQSPSPPPPLGPCGGAAAYERRAFIDAGGFDEKLFAYGEDLDLALRLREAGSDCALATDARAVHVGSGTLGVHSLPKATLVGYARG
jgi:GT2 family glycosyltransferase